jgi:hypothetical protein
MLSELSIILLGGGTQLSSGLGQTLKIIDESGFALSPFSVWHLHRRRLG